MKTYARNAIALYNKEQSDILDQQQITALVGGEKRTSSGSAAGFSPSISAPKAAPRPTALLFNMVLRMTSR